MANTKSSKPKSKPAKTKKIGRPEKYTISFCLTEIREILARLEGDVATTGRGWTYLTWHDLVKDRPYPRQRVSEWRNRFKDNEEFSDTIKKIESELENRLVKLGLKGTANTTMVIFMLKNNYKWVDKQETESRVTLAGDPFLELMKKANIVD